MCISSSVAVCFVCRQLNSWAVIQVLLAERKGKPRHLQIRLQENWIMSSLQKVHMMLRKI